MLSDRKSVLFVVVVVFFVTLENNYADAVDYCKMKSCGNKKHTMCTYSSSKPSSSCTKYTAAPLSSAEQNAIVKRHNTLRKKVADGKEKQGSPGPQPPASNMKQLQWDGELAKIAQRWADQCASGHDSCRDVDRFKVGQNIATHWNSEKITEAIENMVDDWYDEVKAFNKNFVGKYQFSSKTGHYTQLVWAETKYIGCGRIRTYDNSYHMNMMRLVCNYGPTGNILTQPMYKVGSAGSGCPSGKSSMAGDPQYPDGGTRASLATTEEPDYIKIQSRHGERIRACWI